MALSVDCKGVERGHCKQCAECTEFCWEKGGSIKCAYCDCPPALHVATGELFDKYYLIKMTMKQMLKFLKWNKNDNDLYETNV